MSAVPRDRREMELGEFLLHDYGPDAVRDAISDELVREIGELYVCGDIAAIGVVLARTLIADESIQRSMLAAADDDERERQQELFENCPRRWLRLSNYDSETGIPLTGPI